MTSDLISKFFNLIFSPYGILGIIIGLFILDKATRSRRLAWLLFAFCCYATSLGKYQDEWITEPPPLVFPLQQLRDMGRPLTIVLLILLILLGMQTQNGWRRIIIPQPVYYLIAFQVAVFFKVLIYGDVAFALLALITFGAIVLMFKLGPSRWLQDERNFHLSVWSLAMAGVIFAIACAYQARFNMSAMTFVQGRFLGTTGNSQHAAALLAGTVPCFMFLIESRKKWDWIKALWIAILLVVAYFLFLTGSRTGAIMGISSILFFYRNKAGSLLRLGLFIGVLLGVIFWFISPDAISENTSVSNRFISGGNTREGAWAGMWNGFVSNPFFGSPLYGGRLVFGENSWLAAGDTTGLMGFIPIVMMGLGCLKMMFELHKLTNTKPTYFLHSSTVIAGLAGLLVGSFSEAILLGNLSFPVFSLLMYLSLGKYLLDLDRIQKKYFSSQTMQN
ncbi:O-antigen ligase domain-containing protein [Nostoc punctiforme FACHB-252]|uniref:O-antigen ligase domain-containing protein n=1 Tax=Nostoc punctiforme FACHB-252 TaxID=1357509 RepID=A0ABR8H327_NOSPU|nr:O-antigen ligase domain-containing protein [Nostoc punctiforme]MBD2609702.1 O-antigen ligase domain-containing protein [Nostoc punctiforme FACHB-252]